MTRFRAQLFLTGMCGLVGCAILAAGSIWLVSSHRVPVLLPYRSAALLLAGILGAFSLAEVPLMVSVMRRLVMERPGNQKVVQGLNAVYVLFAGIYAAPLLLLTGDWILSGFLFALSLLRLGAAFVFVREAAP